MITRRSLSPSGRIRYNRSIMNLILTHDNADFDAVASQLAAHKLYPEARPLLPARLNRNVQHYMALYWDALPFLRSNDLPREPVEQVIVVDTQTVQSVRGMSPDSTVRIIDHHAVREGIIPAWQITTEVTGACATILCERLRTEHIPISPVEATLLLLGIYEDTGSLTYASTTSRDVYASAWLLERGAHLDVVREFLHHPLSEGQIRLFEQLKASAHTFNIEGHPIVIAAGAAPDLVEEIATLAHKLRDLLDPDGVFILVDLGHHIQMVARSSDDAINVGAIAEQFGGGGHGRASAAILRDITLKEAESALLAALRRAVLPALTVAEMMSHGVQILPPHLRARDAASRMQRYGYEGFPVVSAGKVIGLLTRRAVDRALGHGLSGVRIDQIMDAGEVTLHPDDSISTVQQTMMNTGWGQVPVTNEAGEIVGVVTRTDLIKAMGHTEPDHTPPHAVRNRLETILPPALAALIREAGQAARRMGANLYLVGGGVRDLLLGHPTIDIDFVVEGDAIALARHLCRQFGGETRTHSRFGTGKWFLEPDTWQAVAARLGCPPAPPEAIPHHIDFATARTEFYEAPTVLPEVERSSIKADLHRRDFTINTLAIRLDPEHFGQLLDFYGGEADLRGRRIRVLHSLSFIDDPTRILRAVRFEQRLGFRLEPRTAELLEQAIPLIDRVTGDRLKHELELILDEHQPERSLLRLADLGVLAALHPTLFCDDWTVSAFRALREARAASLWDRLGDPGFDLELPYFALLTFRMDPEDVRALSRRIKVRRSTIDMVEATIRLRGWLRSFDPASPPSVIDATLAYASDEALVSLWAAAPTAAARAAVVDYARHLRYMKPRRTGRDLIEAGMKPGPRIGRALAALRRAWLDGKISAPAEEDALLEKLLAADDSPEETLNRES
jgi:tRNA nucleotidyltransferase (CCA-adding enzyme)